MKRLVLITTLGVATTLLLGTSSAQADVYSCAFSGAMGPVAPTDPNDGGFESILTDLAQGSESSSPGFFSVLLDTDDGTNQPDGTYHLDNLGANDSGQCLTVDDPGEAVTDTGLYSAKISSDGVYQNLICGTGSMADRGAIDRTSVELLPVNALGPGEGITEANYGLQIYAGSGRVSLYFVANANEANPEFGMGYGVVNLVPTTGNCIDQDVSSFHVTGAFTVITQ